MKGIVCKITLFKKACYAKSRCWLSIHSIAADRHIISSGSVAACNSSGSMDLESRLFSLGKGVVEYPQL